MGFRVQGKDSNDKCGHGHSKWAGAVECARKLAKEMPDRYGEGVIIGYADDYGVREPIAAMLKAGA